MTKRHQQELWQQLMEYVINDEHEKAGNLFHEICVTESRHIWEDLMDDESVGGDAADDLIDDIEAEEEGIVEADEEEEEEEESESMEMDDESMEMDDESMEMDDESMEMDDEESGDHHSDVGGEEELEDRVMDLEDKLDELMAEFDALMDRDGEMDMDDDGMDVDMDADDGLEPGAGGDALEVDDTEEFTSDDMGDMGRGMMENVSLDKAPSPKTSEESFVNKKSTVAANSGKTGMAASPVKMTGDVAQGRPAPSTKDLPGAGKFRNIAGKGSSNAKLDAAPKPVTSQASGVNTRTPFPKS